jgi:hypothetical protein
MALSTSLISHWKLSDLTDEVGGNTLTNNNVVTFVAGKVGNAANFVAASSQFLSKADNAALSTGDIDFTFSAWVKFTTLGTNNPQIIAKDSDASNRDYNLDFYHVPNAFRFYINGGSVIIQSTKTDLTTGVWYFVVAWHDSVANTINIQVNNGTIDSAATANTAPSDSAATFCIGARTYATFEGYFDGLVDEVSFRKRTLTAAERSVLYNSGNGLAYPWMGLIAAISGDDD